MLENIKKYSFLLNELVKKGIKLKYRRSYLGILWSLIEPILSTIVLVVVFGTLFHNNNPTYPLYIITGRLFYGFFSSGTNAASSSIRQNAAMINKVYVPKILYPLANVIYNFIITSISFLVLIGVDIYCKVVPTIHILQFIPALLLVFLLTFGVGLILTTLNVFFRDIEYLWNVLLMLIMYASAIFYYPEAILNSNVAWILKYNPLFQIIKLARDAVLGNSFNWNSFFVALIWGIGTLLTGLIFFERKQNKFILHL